LFLFGVRGNFFSMKFLRLFLLVGLWSAGCVSIPPDGDALDCSACETMWIRLLPATGTTAYYRAKREKAPSSCANCQTLAAKYFETGEVPRACPQCGGKIIVRPVNVVR
jgi:DNA-directed RNA polymerase subunit RPC12/RpoP